MKNPHYNHQNRFFGKGVMDRLVQTLGIAAYFFQAAIQAKREDEVDSVCDGQTGVGKASLQTSNDRTAK
jgi:hypothetical protein